MAQTHDAAEEAASYLDDLAGDLATQYPRDAHRGRMEQVAAVARTLAALVRELPGEEEREADLEKRLIVSYRDGGWRGAGPGHAVTHTDHAQDKLAAALRREEGK